MVQKARGSWGRWSRRVGLPLLLAILVLRGGIELSVSVEARLRLRDDALRQRLAPFALGEGEDGVPVLLLHGFGGSPDDMRALAEALAADGRPVAVPVLAGHAGASARALAAAGPGEWVQDAEKALDALVGRGEPCDLVGFSMGGVVAAELATDPRIRRLVLINPYVEVPRPVAWGPDPARAAGLARYLLPYVPKLVSGQIADPEGRRRYAPSYRHLPLRGYLELDRFATEVWARRRDFAVPTLVLISAGDVVTDPAAAQALFASRLEPGRDTLLVFPRSNHVLLFDYEREEAVAAIQGHLEASDAL